MAAPLPRDATSGHRIMRAIGAAVMYSREQSTDKIRYEWPNDVRTAR
jgi:hypothetical protein